MSVLKGFEEYLKKVKTLQKISIYLIPFILSGMIVYMFVIPLFDDELDMLNSEHSKIESNIVRKSPKSLQKKIKNKKTELLTLKEEIEKNRDSLNFLYAKLSNLEILEFDEKEWTATLDSILKKSLELNIKIEHIKNSNSEQKGNNQTIVPKKYVEIVGSGKYSDTLKYLHFIENGQYLVDMKNIKIEKIVDKNRVKFHYNFTIYGVNL